MSSAVFPSTNSYATGLSKRELFALAILHATVSNNVRIDSDYIDISVRYADKLIERLEKK